MTSSECKPWAQLVCTTDTDSEPITIDKDKFTIGRAKDCDLSMPANRLVSGKHCFIQKDGSGRVWLYDTSTNGTLVNNKAKISKGESTELNHGDEIHVVFKKGDEEQNVSYLYQSMAELEREMLDETQEYTADLSDIKEDSDEEPVHVQKRSAEEAFGSDDSTEPKKIKPGKVGEDLQNDSKDHFENKPSKKKHSETEISGGGHKSYNVDSVSRWHEQSALHTYDKEQDDDMEMRVKKLARDEIEETLLCSICQDILHDCVSLQPCMHSFCAGCYSDWMERSHECPSCRYKVERINKNHIVNNLVDAYLKAHPEKRRSAEDLQELDAKNKITKDMLYPPRKKRYSDDEDEQYSDSSGSQSDIDSDITTPAFPAPIARIGGFVFGGDGPPRAVCRSCPGHRPLQMVTPAATVPAATTAVPQTAAVSSPTDAASGDCNAATQGNATSSPQNQLHSTPGTSASEGTSSSAGGAGPSTATSADVKRMPQAPVYICTPQQNHILCQCCFEPMPDRRHLQFTDPEMPRMQCAICHRTFCHAYWGCRRAACLGCLDRFRDLNLGQQCLDHIILDNAYESRIFKEYLQAENLSVHDVLRKCLTKLDARDYTCPDNARLEHLTSETYICYSCGLRNFKELAYEFRRDIPADKLPATVTARPNCYWGRNCRTQRHKPLHAQRFNHICEQTRTL
ncbi:E3 ubiquitin-protein ligase CHFR [Lingula anatina]|uniref:E3 ubiquitin-protein ligase CHFR n=1 Tax=Lingula anatina TaxID=7574 RepID=A0A1S3I0C9_LINAN|nr:E3 ubiquitin-protein ligase CHFR [Lingula anatina]|eukprot:XP_013390804.1 E3 ubiquitin-protein ligase CHFR [Lingula anatina]